MNGLPNLERLQEAVEAVCPIPGGLSVKSKPGQPLVVELGFGDQVTPEQKAAAQAVIDSYDISETADQEWADKKQPIRKLLRDALATNQAFLNSPNATPAQVRIQAENLTKQIVGIIKLLHQLLSMND